MNDRNHRVSAVLNSLSQLIWSWSSLFTKSAAGSLCARNHHAMISCRLRLLVGLTYHRIHAASLAAATFVFAVVAGLERVTIMDAWPWKGQ